ncbi:MAG: diacylglycerol kinase family lipid kinase [Candidatus Competibacteraceae bacterium]|nr:diacylglycerol kinase family lipid kinase [Candidatus Competibacteraceae bacterium]
MTTTKLDLDKEWLVIMNPVSGGNKAKRDKKKILEALDAHKIQYRLKETEGLGHAIALTRDALAEGYRKIMGVGGDGTMNEIVNGIFLQTTVPSTDIAFSFIPVGTGNDWVRTIGIPSDYIGAVRTIKTGHYFYQDVGEVTYMEDGQMQKRYFANIAGMGYDAFVAKAANEKSKGGKKMGKFAYLFQVFRCLMRYKPGRAKVIIDKQEVIEGEMFSLNVAICKFNGNGMMQAPNAIPDDGILDITLYHQPSKMKILTSTPKLYDGSFAKESFVSLHTATQVRVEADPPIMLETDGESLGYSPFEFTLRHRALKIISTITNKQV